MTLARVGVRTGEGVTVALLAIALGVVLTVAIDVAGPAAALLPLALVVCWWLFWHPLTTLGLLFASTVLIEGQKDVWPLTLERWYGTLGPTPVHPPDVLVVLLLAWFVYDRRATGTHGPGWGPFTLPLSLMAVALTAGFVTGFLGESNRVDLVGSARVVLLLLIVPLVTAAVLSRRGHLRSAVNLAVVLVAGRALVALLGLLTNQTGGGGGGGGVAASVSAEASTFYEPTMNFLMVVVFLGVVVALLRRTPVPRWVLIATPLLVVTLALSYRRSFWIAAILGLVLVLLVASGQRGRPWFLLGGAAVVIALSTALSVGGTTETTNPVLYRAESLTPSKITASSGDRYRLQEQKNVIDELREHPLAGLGLGVPWTIRHPLPERHVGGQLYTHVTPLWYWLKLGPMGFVAYLWLWGAALATAYGVWRRSDDPRIRVAALALAAGFAGLIVAELTGPFTGIDVRITLVVGCAFGWLIAADARTGPRHPADRGKAGTAPDYAVTRR